MPSPPSPKPWHSTEEMEKYDSLFPLLPNYVAHYTIGLRHGPRIGISSIEDMHLSKQLRAVLVADAMQLSTPYAEKRYVKDSTETRWLGLTRKIDRLYRDGRHGFGWYLSYSKELEIPPNSYQDLSVQFFYRNLAAFDAAKRLSELGYLCEVAAILRSAIEQFAFSGYLWKLSGDEQLEKIARKQSFSHFKKFVPAVGNLYGLLSKYTHFEYDHHTHFFARSEAEIITVQTAPVLRAYATHTLFVTMACVSKYVLKMASEHFETVPNSILELAEFNKKVSNYSESVCSILPEDEVLAGLDNLLLQILES